MPQWVRANLLLAALLLITAALLLLAYLLGRALGLPPDTRRYILAAAGALAVVVNYLVARRMLRTLTRNSLDDR